MKILIRGINTSTKSQFIAQLEKKTLVYTVKSQTCLRDLYNFLCPSASKQEYSLKTLRNLIKHSEIPISIIVPTTILFPDFDRCHVRAAAFLDKLQYISDRIYFITPPFYSSNAPIGDGNLVFEHVQFKKNSNLEVHEEGYIEYYNVSVNTDIKEDKPRNRSRTPTIKETDFKFSSTNINEFRMLCRDVAGIKPCESISNFSTEKVLTKFLRVIQDQGWSIFDHVVLHCEFIASLCTVAKCGYLHEKSVAVNILNSLCDNGKFRETLWRAQGIEFYLKLLDNYEIEFKFDYRCNFYLSTESKACLMAYNKILAVLSNYITTAEIVPKICKIIDLVADHVNVEALVYAASDIAKRCNQKRIYQRGKIHQMYPNITSK